MKRFFRFSFLAFALVGLSLLTACTADYDTFDKSDYCKMNEIHFVEEESNPSVYATEHKIVVTTIAPPDSLETWDSLTISDIDISSMASLHLVTSKFKTFPTDSLALDSLTQSVSYDKKALKANKKIRIPAGLQVYVMVVSESGKLNLWQIQFKIPGVEAPESSSSVDPDDPNIESSSSSSETPSSSSEEPVLNSDVSLELSFKDALETTIADDTLYVTFAQGTDLKTVSLDTAICHRKSTMSPSLSDLQKLDWSKIQTVKVTAENGDSKTWIVVVRAILSADSYVQFTFSEQFKVNVSGDTIALKLKNGASVDNAVLESYTIPEGASISPNPDSVKTWTASQTFTVTAENGSTQNWVLQISIAEADEKVSTEKELLSISAENETAKATIDAALKTVVLHLPNAEALTSVKVSATVSTGASHTISSTAFNLQSSKTFIITAEDGSSDTWTLSADYPKSSEADILTFELDDFTADVTVDASAKTISFEVPSANQGDIDRVYFSATYSKGAKKTSPTVSYLNLESGSAKIQVTAEDASVVTWTVKATIAAVAPQITAMTLGTGKVAGTIDQTAGTIFFNMTYATDLDLRSLNVVSLSLSEGAKTSDIAVGSAYNFAKEKTVTVSNSAGDSKTYKIKAGYQYPGSNFNTWISDDFGNTNDVEGWDNGNNDAMDKVKTLTEQAESGTVVKMTSKNATILGIGRFASGNMLTAYFNPKKVATLKLTQYDEGNELIDFGRPFYGRPQYVEFDVKYSGAGDSCDLYVLLENRSRTTDEGKNQYRTSSDVNTLVASAWYRATTVESTEDPDVVSITDASRDGYKTIRLQFKYGEPSNSSPIYDSRVFTAALVNTAGIDNHLVKTTSPDSFDVTHIRIVMASSAKGNVYEGSVDATLYCDEIRLIY